MSDQKQTPAKARQAAAHAPINWAEVAKELKGVLLPGQALVVVIVDPSTNTLDIHQHGINGTYSISIEGEEEGQSDE